MQTRILNLLYGNESPVAQEELDVKLTLEPVKKFLEERARTNGNIKSAFIGLALEQFNHHTDLHKDITLDQLMQRRELLDAIYAALSVSVEDEKDHLWALCAPLTPLIFYGTDAVYSLFVDDETGRVKNTIIETHVEIAQNKRPELLYTLILSKVFHFPQAFKTQLVKTILDETTGLQKHFRLNFDMRFLNVYPKETVPDLSNEKLQSILHEPNPLQTLFSLLPFNLFRFEGLSIVTLTDVTEHYAIEGIKNYLFQKNNCSVDEYYNGIVQSLKTLVNCSNVEFGLLPVLKVNDKLVFNSETCLHSRLITSARNHGIAETAYLTVAENYFKNPRLLYFKNITPEDEAKHIYLKLLKVDGICSYALMPIFYNNTLAGTLEVYSRKEGVLTEQLLLRLDPAVPLIAQLLQSGIEEFNAKIENIVKEKFTSLQPAVEWKFNEAAWNYLKASARPNPKMETIFFRDVYPLYGAIDIRNSTVERNNALRSDMHVLYNKLQKTLTAIQNITNLPIIGELIYKCNRRFSLIFSSDTDNESMDVNDFLQNEVDPLMSYFRKTNSATVSVIDEYYNAADEHTGAAYENRRQLEQSMDMITSAINNYLELFIVEQKQSYPCYFEKFRTDGIEYDIYIGQSIAPDIPFDLLYLRNLRLWQVASMAAITRLTHLLQPQLPKRLQTTQLIFTNSNTIDICFRNDERRFDVEGAYNIRYQIIKKRVDKVNIKGTNERLTQTGKIAIIYHSAKDVEEYVKYVQYLQAQGTLNDDLEELELEELQGVKGLKALRVGVKLEEDVKKVETKKPAAEILEKTPSINPN